MTRAEVWWLHVATLLVALSGGAYAVSRYLLPHDDPFSNAGSAWEPWALAAHVLSAPILVFAVGFIYRRHVLRQRFEGRVQGRVSGNVILYIGGLSVVTGYVFEVVTQAGPRRLLSLGHIATGIVFAMTYVWHGVSGAQRRGAGESSADTE